MGPPSPLVTVPVRLHPQMPKPLLVASGSPRPPALEAHHSGAICPPESQNEPQSRNAPAFGTNLPALGRDCSQIHPIGTLSPPSVKTTWGKLFTIVPGRQNNPGRDPSFCNPVVNLAQWKGNGLVSLTEKQSHSAAQKTKPTLLEGFLQLHVKSLSFESICIIL